MTQPETPAMESVYDALKSLVHALGGTKVVGPLLWPAKSVTDAQRLLADTLNPARAEKLDPEQVVFLLRLACKGGYHEAKRWLDRECGYTESAPIDPREVEQRIVQTIGEATVTLQRALEALDKSREREIRAAVGLKAVG